MAWMKPLAELKEFIGKYGGPEISLCSYHHLAREYDILQAKHSALKSGIPSEQAISEVSKHLHTIAGALRWAIEESGGHIVEPCELCGEEHWAMGAQRGTGCPNSRPGRFQCERCGDRFDEEDKRRLCSKCRARLSERVEKGVD